MSEVNRYKVVTMLSEEGNKISYKPHGPDVVTARDYDAAQSELAALREELSKRPSEIAMSLQTKLKAAEQRNAELLKLLYKARQSVDPSCSGKPLREELDAALQPTESGASE